MSALQEPFAGFSSGEEGPQPVLRLPVITQRPPHSVPAPRYMTVDGVRAPVDPGLAESGYDYEQFTNLAGPMRRPSPDEPYRVQYRGIHRSGREWVTTRLIALVLVALDVRFIYWLVFQSQDPNLRGRVWD